MLLFNEGDLCVNIDEWSAVCWLWSSSWRFASWVCITLNRQITGWIGADELLRRDSVCESRWNTSLLSWLWPTDEDSVWTCDVSHLSEEEHWSPAIHLKCANVLTSFIYNLLFAKVFVKCFFIFCFITDWLLRRIREMSQNGLTCLVGFHWLE